MSPFEDQSRPYDSKKNVWIPDPEEGYVEGEIKSEKGNDVIVTVKGGSEVTTSRQRAPYLRSLAFSKPSRRTSSRR